MLPINTVSMMQRRMFVMLRHYRAASRPPIIVPVVEVDYATTEKRIIDTALQVVDSIGVPINNNDTVVVCANPTNSPTVRDIMGKRGEIEDVRSLRHGLNHVQVRLTYDGTPMSFNLSTTEIRKV